MSHKRENNNWQKQFIPILVSMIKSKKEYKHVCENAWGRVVEKLEFIENGKYFEIFLSLCFFRD